MLLRDRLSDTVIELDGEELWEGLRVRVQERERERLSLSETLLVGLSDGDFETVTDVSSDLDGV